MVNNVENEGKVKKISKFRMGLKFVRLFLYRIRKRAWFLPTIDEMTTDELLDRINTNLAPLLIDLRGEDEFNGIGENSYMTVLGHIPNAKRMGIMELSSNLENLQSYVYDYKEKEIVTICPGGGMSLIAVEIMTDAGFTEVKSLKGGIWEWHKKEYPVTTTS